MEMTKRACLLPKSEFGCVVFGSQYAVSYKDVLKRALKILED